MISVTLLRHRGRDWNDEGLRNTHDQGQSLIVGLLDGNFKVKVLITLLKPIQYFGVPSQRSRQFILAVDGTVGVSQQNSSSTLLSLLPPSGRRWCPVPDSG